MRIGVFGTGGMAQALGGGCVRAGHDVVVGGRNPVEAARVAAEIGVCTGGFRRAAEFGDVVLLAVHHHGIDHTLAEVGPPAGNVLIDCTNAVETERYTSDLPPGFDSLALFVADRTGARVVKAFHTAEAASWADPGAGATVLCCGTEDARSVVTGLSDDVGHVPVRCGGIDRAAHREASLATVIWLLGHDQPAGSGPEWIPGHTEEGARS